VKPQRQRSETACRRLAHEVEDSDDSTQRAPERLGGSKQRSSPLSGERFQMQPSQREHRCSVYVASAVVLRPFGAGVDESCCWPVKEHQDFLQLVRSKTTSDSRAQTIPTATVSSKPLNETTNAFMLPQSHRMCVTGLRPRLKRSQLHGIDEADSAVNIPMPKNWASPPTKA
jgi:hypothetical protein